MILNYFCFSLTVSTVGHLCMSAIQFKFGHWGASIISVHKTNKSLSGARLNKRLLIRLFLTSALPRQKNKQGPCLFRLKMHRPFPSFEITDPTWLCCN